jgi:putative transposase
LARVIGVTGMMHTQAVNRERGWKGHLWAERFFSTPMDQNHFLAAVPYVELNPVRAAMVDRAEEYQWSSARAHVLGENDPLLAPDALFGLEDQVGDWSQWLEETNDRKKMANLRECTRTGRPCGSDTFLKIVSRMTGRNVMKRTPGRRPLEK